MEQLTFDLRLCACGCGQVTPLARFTNRAAGLIAGQPTRFIHGHARRMRIDENGRQCGECGEYKPWVDFHVSRTTRYGHTTICKLCLRQKRKTRERPPRVRGNKLCECGCGQFTNLAVKTNPATGHVKGQPIRFIKGHFKRSVHLERTAEPTVRSPRQPSFLPPTVRNLRLNYGITPEKYCEMVANQCGACAICGELPGADPGTHNKANKLVVDHDHETGEVRDLLCSACNLMLGQSRDDIARLRAGADYLARWAA